MSDWKKVRLGNYIHEYSERNKDDADIPVYSVTNSNGFCTEYFSKEVASKDKTTYKIVRKGYFAYNPSRINVGSVDWLRNEDAVIVSPLYNVFYVDDSIDQQYLYYYLKSPVGSYYISELASGSVRDNLKLSILSEFRIPLPDMKTQKEIVATLDSIVHMISVCNAILKKIDLLVKSRFVEMFNTGEYTTVKLKSVCSKITDGTHKTPNYLSEGITFISAKNIINGELDFSDVKYISETEYIEIQKRCQTDIYDILLSKSGSLGSPTILRTDKPLGLFESLAIIKYDRRILLPEFLCEQLKTDDIQRQFKTGTKGVAIKHLHLNVIGDIDVVVPPLALQQQFADFVEQTDKSKFIVDNIKKIIRRVRIYDQL